MGLEVESEGSQVSVKDAGEGPLLGLGFVSQNMSGASGRRRREAKPAGGVGARVLTPASPRVGWAVSAGSDAGARGAPTLCQALELSGPGCPLRGASHLRDSVYRLGASVNAFLRPHRPCRTASLQVRLPPNRSHGVRNGSSLER